jgi:hypothetical protein
MGSAMKMTVTINGTTNVNHLLFAIRNCAKTSDHFFAMCEFVNQMKTPTMSPIEQTYLNQLEQLALDESIKHFERLAELKEKALARGIAKKDLAEILIASWSAKLERK